MSEQMTFTELLSGLTQEYIRESIGSGTGFSGGKQRVRDYFAKETDRKLRANFLRDEYGIGGWAYCDDNGISHHLNHDARGLEIVRGEERVVFRWEKVAVIIDNMIKEGVYG